MANERILWSISEFANNYTAPSRPGDFVYRVADGGGCKKGPQQWPLFHPSEADPEAGYRTFTYTLLFDLDVVCSDGYALRIDYLTIAPRLAHLELRVNGVSGRVYLRPRPSTSGEIRLHAGLHAAIYSEGSVSVALPAALLRCGENRIEFVARDGADDVIYVEKLEARKRLDRMANGAGLVYQGISLVAGGSVGDSVSVEPTVVYRRDAQERLWERCFVEIALAGPTAGGPAVLEIGEQWVPLTVPAAAFGQIRLPFDLLDGAGLASWQFRGASLLGSGTVQRRRKWQVYLTPHAHTDIGYTHRQWEVAERLCRNLDTALDLADQGFTYHLDSAWALETWLATRSAEQRARLVEHVCAGRISVASNYVDLLTHTAALEDLIRSFTTTDALLRPLGLSSDFACVVDVASITSAFPDVAAGAGVKYLAHADNQDRGPFRLNGGLNRVSPFWWEGPAGGRVLVWLAKMYCELRKVCGSPPTLSSAARGLDLWLQEYDHAAYAPDAVMLYGMEADNTDLDPQPASFVADWNATYAYPQLIPCDVSGFFRYVSDRWGSEFAVFRGDGGAYWEDGASSSLAETIGVRAAQGALPAAERLEALAVMQNPGLAYPGAQFDEAFKQVLLYDEHTWGAFLSCSEPDALLAADQWEVKAGFAQAAKGWAKRLLHVAAVRHSLQWNTDGREVVVYNPHNWAVTGTAVVEIEPSEVLIDPASGEPVPTRLVRQMASQAVVEFSAALDGLSYRRFVLERRGGVAASAATPVDQPVVVENAWYRLTVDPATACAVTWFDKELGRELACGPFGQLIYAEGGEGTRLCSSQSNLPLGDPSLLTSFAVGQARLEQDALGSRVVISGHAACGDVTVTWSLPAGVKAVDVQYQLMKAERRSKEALYVAFPLDLPGAAVASDAQLGWVNWHTEQLPGGCKEWLPVQSGIHVSGTGADVLICSPDIPLFCVGDVVRGRWPKQADLTGGKIYSYVLNNYWHTNYKAAQGGMLAWSYRLTSGAQIDKALAYRTGWAVRRPLYAHRISFQDFRTVSAVYGHPAGGSLATVGPDTVALSTIKGARLGEGFVLRLQGLISEPQVAFVSLSGVTIKRAWLTDLLEQDLSELAVEADGSLRVPVCGWGLTTFRVLV